MWAKWVGVAVAVVMACAGWPGSVGRVQASVLTFTGYAEIDTGGIDNGSYDVSAFVSGTYDTKNRLGSFSYDYVFDSVSFGYQDFELSGSFDDNSFALSTSTPSQTGENGSHEVSLVSDNIGLSGTFSKDGQFVYGFPNGIAFGFFSTRRYAEISTATLNLTSTPLPSGLPLFALSILILGSASYARRRVKEHQAA